ncbi:Ferrochelatase [Methyloligella halotolerans]|uniref:Ferrochelatase n=1 Tax=Methyloligella halotolerans TaxID=1177755 RepID=A0A1E2RZ32_9HYPH|nr:Ferrochelatase [Methyloligella halotolerans]
MLLVNLGTPDDTTYWPMRRYLKEFLSDRRVIETPRVIWWPVLNGIILTVRPSKSGQAYASIWDNERGESPLRTITRNQAEKLAIRYASMPEIVVDWAMRYGTPSIAARIDALASAGCDRLLVFPLYPQYAAPTTATVNDKAFEALQQMRFQPAVRTVPAYPTDPVYIEALANSVRNHLARLDYDPEVILASFHGLPKKYIEKGDPYQGQCKETADALRAALGFDEHEFRLTFQSRFGPEEWLTPYTDETVEELAKEGVKSLAIMTPGFVADCVETLEEINGEAREIFEEHGGEKFSFIPCLNDSDDGMRVLEAVIDRELQGWVR